MKIINFSLINLGCSKNTVDSEFILGELLKTSPLTPLLSEGEGEFIFFDTPEDEEVEYVILNTCGFISSSRDEAEEMMEYLDTLGKKIILVGCYIPVKDDKFLKSLENLVAVVPYEELKNESLKQRIEKLKEKFDFQSLPTNKDKRKEKAFIFGTESVRAFLLADKGYEYLKIAEGCNNNCSFCIIPNIRGKQTSRSIEDILQEVRQMLNAGIKEIEIIAEDTTRYGIDLYKTPKLLELLEEIDEIPGDFKYRLFYMYPDILSLKHLERLSKLKKFLPYFDFPFQHISPKILKKMGRFYDDKHIYKLIDYIKLNFKNPFFHTNFIIGFPSETEEDFEMLLNFVKRVEFDSVSVFGYHDEPLAESSKLDEKVENKVIIERVKRLKKVLNEIYDKKAKAMIGKEQIGFIEEVFDDYAMIRPEIKAPEIDDLDKVKFENILEGEVEVGEKVKYYLN